MSTGAGGAPRAAPPTDKAEAPPFEAPWQAEIFALMVALRDRGLIEPREWAMALGEAVRAGAARGDAADAASYWRQWAEALETLLVAKNLAATVTIEARAAALATRAAGEHAADQAALVPASLRPDS